MATRTQTMVQLNEELLELLDQRAARAGVSRSQLIREAIEEYLAADWAAAIDRQIVEGYTRMPQGGRHDADEWGDMGSLVTALTADQMRQLNEEERESGYESW
jgi:predicted transcriptional regulator